MISKRRYLLNKFLLACIFLGVIMILIKEKEGFASHYHNIDTLYKGPILDKIESPDDTYMAKNLVPNLRDSVVRIKKYSEITDNFGIHPCNDKNTNGNKMCENFYKANDVVIGPKEKACMPGFGCRRVGFYCSLID